MPDSLLHVPAEPSVTTKQETQRDLEWWRRETPLGPAREWNLNPQVTILTELQETETCIDGRRKQRLPRRLLEYYKQVATVSPVFTQTAITSLHMSFRWISTGLESDRGQTSKTVLSE